MKRSILIVAILALIKLSIHFSANSNYGFHRDELLHLSVSQDLRWGYMEFPPFIAAAGKVSSVFFNYSVFGTRVFPTLAGVFILVLTCLLAREMGGGNRAMLLAGVTVLCFLPFYRNHTLFQPVAFDQLFWVLGLYFLVRYFNTSQPKFLLLMGATAGLGLLNKYTFLIWGLSLVVAIVFFEKGILFRNKWLYISGAVAALIFLPNIVWQANHNFPLLMHHQKLQEIQLSELKWWDFPVDQLQLPFTLAIAVFGVVALLRNEALVKYRSLAIFFLTAFAVMWFTKSKGYYFFAAYPIAFAAGAVAIERAVQRPWVHYAIIVVLVIPTIIFLPNLTPVLPVERFVKWKKMQPNAEGRFELTSDYADMFGWEEQVKLVDSVYRSLNEADQKQCIIWAENYGEAGAVKVLGKKYNLPDPICTHGSFWLMGPGEKKGEVCVSIGNEEPSVSRVFQDYTLIKIIKHKYAIDEEHNIPLYLCRNPKVSLQERWPLLEKYVFD
jgi:4-amino-4-deoxy-L-arabinose transferase-like glycosyltransferase